MFLFTEWRKREWREVTVMFTQLTTESFMLYQELLELLT